ncbi:MAG: zf-HC2 domain-containing protein [Planctomycetota bacterium]
MSECGKLIQYLYNELSEADKTVFEAHLKTCSECRSELADYKKIVIRLENLPSYEPVKSIIAPRSYRRAIFRWSAVAAGFICLALVMHFYIFNPQTIITEPVMLDDLNNVEAEISEISDKAAIFSWNLSTIPSQGMDNSVEEIKQRIEELDKEIDVDLAGF